MSAEVLKRAHYSATTELKRHIEGGLADLYAGRGLTNVKARRDQLSGTCDLIRGKSNGAPPFPPSCSGSFQSCAGPLADQVSLELTEGSEEMKHQPPGRGGRIDCLGQ